MPNIDLSILNQRQTPAFFADTLANRPAAGFLGRIFVSTDTYAFYRDNGTGWDLIGGPGTGTITGSGTAGTIPLWNGASSIGNSDLRQLSTEALILNSATDDFPSSNFGNEPGRFLITSATNNPLLVLWGKNAFGSGDEQGSLALGNVSALGSTNFGGAILDGSIENGTDGSGQLKIKTTNSAGSETLALKIDSTQKSTFYNDIILSSGASTKRLILDADVNVARIFSIRTNNLPRWAFRVDGTESGTNTGSDLAFRRYNDAGTFVDAPLSINRASGQSTFAKKVVIENNTGDQQLQIVSSTAPSLRIDNLQIGATQRIGIGLATTTNNFIQGTTGGEMAIFNSSTTASPILFGVYDAGLSNTQEAARISPARNFIVGKTADSGERLQISGTSLITGAATFSSNITSNITSGSVLTAGNGNTSSLYSYFVNSGGNTFYGVESSIGGGIFPGSSAYASIFGTSALTSIQLATNNFIRVTVSSAGNLLIGTATDAGYKLRVAGTSEFTNQITNSVAGHSSIGLYLTTFQPSGINWFDNDDFEQYSIGILASSGTGYWGVWSSTSATPINRSSSTPKFSVYNNGKINMSSLPTSAAGLSAGDIWNNGGVLNIV